ncbi:AsmA family protein [Vibrio pectenicida]|uniref:AsmA family protein n=1 Tax=Vibrio pectenicida TaxID=62763 RepID=A0A427U803_9VIBR|nr:AsmA family protein [Vibrio pectenicida]RSD32835.1 AsmA family protein [Vibrio pectenicida]
MFKKALLITTVTTLSMIGLLMLSIFFLLQSSYSGKVVNAMLSQLTPYTVSAQQASYSPPYQLTLMDVKIGSSSQPIHIPKLSLWLSPSLWKNQKLSIDSILIEEANLDFSALGSPILKSFNIQHLALQNVDIKAPNWSARDVNIQIKQPVWLSPQQGLPYGEVQLSAQQLYVGGEALDKLLIDAQYQGKSSTIYGASFKWNGAEISGQAEQFEPGWSLINVTINKLKLPHSSSISTLLSKFEILALPIYHINSLDILNSDLHYAGWQFNQVDASLENFLLDRTIWQQKQTKLSFDAESIDFSQLRLVGPTAKLTLGDNGISLDEFDADFKQGRLQMNGIWSKKNMQINWLKASGIKWLDEVNQLFTSLSNASRTLDSLTIKQLKIKNTQIIQVEQRPYWQLSGVNIEGKNLNLIQDGEVNLYNGSLEVSANNASIDNFLTSQAIINVTAKSGDISLERAFLPLAKGYIEANGRWQRQAISDPWYLSLHLDGLPIDQPLLQAQLPFQVTGMAEADLVLSGLSGDYPILAHSLTGFIDLQLHNAALQVDEADSTIGYQQEWPLDTVKIRIDRGRININSRGSKAELAGNIDLTKYQFGTLIFTSENGCKRLWSDILSQTNAIQQTCPFPKSDSSPSTQTQDSSLDKGKPRTDL